MKEDPKTQNYILECSDKVGGIKTKTESGDVLCSILDLNNITREVADAATKDAVSQISYIKEQAQLSLDKRELTSCSMHALAELGSKIRESNKLFITDIRNFRMSVDSEVTMIEKASARLSNLKLESHLKTIKDLANILNDPAIKKLIGVCDE